MKLEKMRFLWPLALATVLAVCAASVISAEPPEGKGKPDEGYGNNLSYPVIWAEGITKVLRGVPGDPPLLDGAWWYQWGTNGTDPDVTPASCLPDPDDNFYCDDGVADSIDVDLDPRTMTAENPLPLAKAYLQKDEFNVWQAASFTPPELTEVYVDRIDWGDNLESVDWYTRSQVRTEVVLFEDTSIGVGDVEGYLPVDPVMLEYEMRHTSGWGINEVHGLAEVDGAVSFGPGTRATVYSHCARLTIQKLLVDRDDPLLADLVWEPEVGWTGLSLINEPIFNMPVYEGGDGPGYYSAEINVKGRVIYGYTWNVRRLNEGAGDYRITFSFDTVCDGVALNTFFVDGITEILLPAEEVVIEEEPEGGGAVGVLRTDLNLTYMDVRILERGGGGKTK